MKQSIIKSINLLLLVWTAIWFAGCKEEDGKFKQYVYPAPEVASVSPASGYINTKVTILGNNFGDRTEPVKVFFGGVQAKNILSCKNNCIVVEVPDDAITGDVTLQVWTNTIENIASYTVMPLPAVLSLSTNNEIGDRVARAGDEVTISGTGFGTDKSKLLVKFAGTAVDIVSLTDTEIKLTAPEGYESGEVTVTVNGYTMSAGSLLNPDAKGDISSVYLKNYKQPFASVELTAGQSGSSVSWGIPADWTVTDGVKNVYNTGATEVVGGVNYKLSGGALSMQASKAWNNSAPNSETITNGKIYQTLQLPEGTYRLEVSYVENNVAALDAFAIVYKGTTLPDAGGWKGDEDTQTLAYSKFAKEDGECSWDKPATEVLRFTLEEATELTIGLSANFVQSHYIKVSEFKLIME